ncbi:unnamed protein product, partial [Gongylonema pulchrum]|uniref:Uncharacterized protein n=1 Tax=Gongylonema pulchrum TaxID=637853 RepID=A0A183DM55_9BILA
MSRVRSESIGSGRSTPYSRRHVSNDTSGDHVPVDFGFISHVKSASGSVQSADSPSRSRTSSFGCGQRYYGIRDPGDIVVHATDADFENAATPAPRRIYESCKEQ